MSHTRNTWTPSWKPYLKLLKCVEQVSPSVPTNIYSTRCARPGFSYIETWQDKKYVTTSGLIVHPDYRGRGLAKRIKDMTFTLARIRWPHAKIFSLTSGAAVMAMNTQLGYKPVTFADLTQDEAFWKGCEGCVNVDILHRTGRRYCICTGMLYDPEEYLPAKISDDVLRRIKEIENNK